MKHSSRCGAAQDYKVSLCVREWIETAESAQTLDVLTVSLCVREWIETDEVVYQASVGISLPLREGVD